MEQWHFCKSFQSLHVVVLLKIGGSRAWDGGGGGCHARSASTSSRRDPPTRNNLRSFSFHSTRPQLFYNESESDQILSSDPQQFALLLVSSIVLSWKWWMCSTLQLKRTGFFYICFLLLKAKCHIFGHQFSVVQLICLYLLVNSKGNSRSKLWQTQRQGGGEEILSHENGCASAASVRSRNMLMEQGWAWLLRELHARQVQTEPAVARVLLKTVFLKNFHCFWFKTQILGNYLPLVKTQNKNLVNNNLD